MKKIKDIFFKGKDIRGEIGIEIEMEGKNFIMEDLDSWYSREDGSLRGDVQDCREYVLIRPCKREDTLERLSSLALDLREHGSKIVQSYRTGVHIHTNVRDFTFNQVFTYIFSYYMFEDVLMEFAGKDRVGNLFCLRARDAEGITGTLTKAIKQRDIRFLYTDAIRYSSMNLKALKQYGSIEFRGLPFNGDFHNIETWIQLLLMVKDFSLTVKDPKELVALLSKRGGEALAKEVFGDLLPLLPKVDWDNKLLSSIRLVQRLVYLIDWEENEDKVTLIPSLLKEKKGDEEEILIKPAIAVNPIPRPAVRRLNAQPMPPFGGI